MPIRPAYPDAGTISQNWQRGVTQNADKWLTGMQNPRKDPKAAALAAGDSYKNGVQKALTDKAYEKGIQSYDPAQALATAEAIGPQGYAAGALARTQKHANKMAKVAPLMGQAVTAVRAMPNATDADRENRAVAMIRNARAVGRQVAGRQ